MVVEFAGSTHIGLKRKENQDSFLAERYDGVVCLAVADGMGGHDEGRLASETAISTLREGISKQPPATDGYEVWCRDLEKSAHQAVHEISKGNQIVGTTLTLGVIDGSDCYIGHVGDSRVYRYRGGQLDQLTEDHTWEEFALRHKIDNPHGKALRQAVGVGEAIEPESHKVTVESGDSLLFCSDGLYKMVDDSAICLILSRARNAEAACKDLIDNALRAGGKDNIAVCVGRFGQPGKKPPISGPSGNNSDLLLKILIGLVVVLLALLAYQLTR